MIYAFYDFMYCPVFEFHVFEALYFHVLSCFTFLVYNYYDTRDSSRSIFGKSL